jgi:hypothetical protein
MAALFPHLFLVVPIRMFNPFIYLDVCSRILIKLLPRWRLPHLNEKTKIFVQPLVELYLYRYAVFSPLRYILL